MTRKWFRFFEALWIIFRYHHLSLKNYSWGPQNLEVLSAPLDLWENLFLPRNWMKEFTFVCVWNTAWLAWLQSSGLWMLIIWSVYSLGIPFFLFSLGLPVSEALLMYVEGKNRLQRVKTLRKSSKTCVGRLWFVGFCVGLWYYYYDDDDDDDEDDVSFYFFPYFFFSFTLPRRGEGAQESI